MANSRTIGEICFLNTEFDWKIENFSSLSETVDCSYCSPSFDFCGRSCCLELYPEGNPSSGSSNYIALYLNSGKSDSSLEIQFSLGIKAANGETEFLRNSKHIFPKEQSDWGWSRFCLRSELLRRKDQLDCITLTARLKADREEALNEGPKDVSIQTAVDYITEDDKEEPSQKTGREKVLQDIRRLWLGGDNSDVVIKVGDAEFKAHRTILGARTPVLSAMFKHDTEEKNSGEVTIDDCEPSAFEQLLHYIYTGAPRELNAENAAALYVAADKYLVSEVKQMCVRYMQDTLCLNSFCDVVTLSLVHKEDELLEMAIDFFSKNMVDVMKTVEWQKFLRDHSAWANEITIRALEFHISGESNEN